MENEQLDALKERSLSLPSLPGVYLMKDKQGKIIYIGKAKNLKNRVHSYFVNIQNHSTKVYRMVMNVDRFEFIVASSEFEALVLECSLIKQYHPKYNILLKDDKGYHYIRISPPPYSNIYAEKSNKAPGEYLGPFTSSYAVTNAVEQAKLCFKLPSCNKKFPEGFGGRPCLNYHIKRCMGVCSGKVPATEYNQILAMAVDYIKNGATLSTQRLTEEMNNAADRLEFEKAAKLRDQIAAISKITAQQKVVLPSGRDEDFWGMAFDDSLYVLVLIQFRDGQLCNKEDFVFSEEQDPTELFSQVLLQYYDSNRQPPPVISVDRPLTDREVLSRYLSETAGKNVLLRTAQKGDPKRITDMAKSNALELLAMKTSLPSKTAAALDELKSLLALSAIPRYIEAYDISNWGDTGIVGGMVVLKDGLAYKKAYRRFAIRSQEGPNDVGAMSEVLTRRFDRYLQKEADVSEGFGRLPDLILLDGGKAQLSAVRRVMEEKGLSIPCFGMVKDQSHKTRALVSESGELALNQFKKAFILITTLQNEVHRFAVEYQRKLHKKQQYQSPLLGIRGVGKETVKALFKAFKTVSAMKSASLEELKNAGGISKKVAESIYLHFHGEE